MFNPGGESDFRLKTIITLFVGDISEKWHVPNGSNHLIYLHLMIIIDISLKIYINYYPNFHKYYLFFTAQVQKRLRRERRARRQLQEQLETEVKRRIQLEEALKAAGAGDQIRIINGKILI